jgi:hypothetical protein
VECSDEHKSDPIIIVEVLRLLTGEDIQRRITHRTNAVGLPQQSADFEMDWKFVRGACGRFVLKNLAGGGLYVLLLLCRQLRFRCKAIDSGEPS